MEDYEIEIEVTVELRAYDYTIKKTGDNVRLIESGEIRKNEYIGLHQDDESILSSAVEYILSLAKPDATRANISAVSHELITQVAERGKRKFRLVESEDRRTYNLSAV